VSTQTNIIFEALVRFDGLKAIGVSRYHLRRRIRADAAPACPLDGAHPRR